MSSSKLLVITLPLFAFVPGERAPLSTLDGAVEVTSFGTAEVSPDLGAPVATLHVRASYANRGALPWTIDAAATRVAIGGVVVAPLFVNSDASTLPLVRVSRGEHRVVDFFFELPAGFTTDEQISELSVIQQIATPDRRYEGRTRLARESIEDEREMVRIGASRNWWATPNHAWTTFYHRDGQLVPRPPRHATISRFPTASYIAVPDDVQPEPRTDECNEW